MNSYKKLAKNSAIFAVGNFSSKFVLLLMLPFYTKFLSQNDYGQIDIILTTLSLLLPMFTMNIVEAVVRFSLDRKNNSYEEVLTNCLLFVVFGFLVLLLLFPVIRLFDFISGFMVYFYVLFLLQAIHTIIKQFVRSIDLSKVYMFSDIRYTFSFVIFNFLFIYFLDYGIKGYILSMIFAYSFDLVCLSIKINIKRFISLNYFNYSKLKKMIVYCIPLIPNTIMWWVIGISDRYMLVYFVGFAANGIYAVANKIPAIISNFHSVFIQAWQLSAVEEYEKANKNEFYTNVFNFLFFAMLTLSSLYLIFNKAIIQLFVSADFYSSWSYAQILILGVIFSSLSSFIGTIYIANKKTKGALYTSLAGAILNLILNLVLIPIYGIYGATLSTVFSFFLMWILRIIDTKKYITIKYPLRRMLVSFVFFITQMLIGYLNISVTIFILLNSSIFLIILVLGMKYVKPPFLAVINNFRKRVLK
jgi:O-antigen/teichoic acid export membrane protein